MNVAPAPYRADSRSAALFTPLSRTARLVFIGLVVAMLVGFLATVSLWTAAFVMMTEGPRAHPDDTLMGLGVVAFFLWVPLLYAQIAVGLVWVHKAWSWLPWDQRYTKHWRGWITPQQASLMLLIPYFHYFWMFVANLGLCDALDRLRVTYPTREPAPRGLAIAACICQLFVPFPVGSILWILFMTRVERMTNEMSTGVAARVPSF